MRGSMKAHHAKTHLFANYTNPVVEYIDIRPLIKIQKIICKLL